MKKEDCKGCQEKSLHVCYPLIQESPEFRQMIKEVLEEILKNKELEKLILGR